MAEAALMELVSNFYSSSSSDDTGNQLKSSQVISETTKIVPAMV